MQNNQTKSTNTSILPSLDLETLEELWQIFVQIGRFWRTIDDSEHLKTRFLSFIANRIEFAPTYQYHYKVAARTISRLRAEKGDEEAYTFLFTDSTIRDEAPAVSELAITRQLVSNEFVNLHMALGGFKTYGAKNYPGYFGGAFVPGEAAPYRTREDK